MCVFNNSLHVHLWIYAFKYNIYNLYVSVILMILVTYISAIEIREGRHTFDFWMFHNSDVKVKYLNTAYILL